MPVNRLDLLQVAEHRVAENLIVAGLPHDVEASFAPAPQIHEFCRPRDVQRLQQHLVEAGKIAALAPIPSARETMAMIVTNGVLKSVRRANFRLLIGLLDEKRV